MLGRTPAEAANEYVSSIQRVISCVSNAVVTVRGGYYPDDRPHTLELNEGNLIGLAGATRAWLFVQQYYRIVESEVTHARWMALEVGYRYRILDSDRREILSYHWHPTGRSSFISQHLHIGHGAMAAREELQTAHLPTGHVSAADILRLLIRDFGVTPRRGDWESILSRPYS